MKVFTILLLVGLTVAAPTSKENSDEDLVVVVDQDFFPEKWVRYESSHEIVNILVPLNSLNFNEDSFSFESSSIEDDPNLTIFFVEADITSDGKRIDQGLYVFKDNKAKKLLDNGRDMAASGDDSKLVFLGASDGIYVYKQDENTAEKYGTVNDDIINIAKEKDGNVIYILTANKEVYKVTDNGNVKEKIEDVVNAEQIMLDYSNNLYFYTNDKQPYVRTSEGVKKINGLPENPSSVTLIKPPFIMDDGVPFIVDYVAYHIYANGTSEPSGFEFEPKYKPTAYAMEAALIQYYAHDKKIYEYNIQTIVISSLIEKLIDFVNDKNYSIETLTSDAESSF